MFNEIDFYAMFDRQKIAHKLWQMRGGNADDNWRDAGHILLYNEISSGEVGV